jgi:hypothetical protein
MASEISLSALLVVVLAASAPGCTLEASAQPSTPDDAVEPRQDPSPEFWEWWSDGNAELSAYTIRTPRYGEIREGSTVLIYVLEEHDRRNWIKDDRGAVPDEHRTIVMKLNHLTRFQTGIYPYAVMRSVFSPVHGIGRERFAPTRITFTSQEWCGQVFQRVMPQIDRFSSEMRSYFSVEGEAEEEVRTAPFALYEDALLIQLREIDGPFADGGDWSGQVVPALWTHRRSHQPLRALDATIRRSQATLEDGTAVTRFVLDYGDRSRTFDVERDLPRRILRWTTSEGEVAEIAGTERLPYWRLNDVGDESYRPRIGLDPQNPRTLPGSPTE